MSEPLLLEIGCEEIPARMIRAAAADLKGRVVGILDQAGLAHGESQAWGGSRRLTVRVDAVAARQEDRDQQVLGPPASVAFTAEGALTPAALGFAKKQGIDPKVLTSITTDKGSYVGFTKRVEGSSVGAVLAAGLPPALATMSFPKTMRWSDGEFRWVRPVHWLLALHDDRTLDIRIFGVDAGNVSVGHRFLSKSPAVIASPDRYADALIEAFVVVDPVERRRRLAAEMERKAQEIDARIVEDDALLEEVVDLVEWPGVVLGRFDDLYLELPREILITTLRHHQKCFSVEKADGSLASAFLAVANTDRDPGGHIRRGNEWVVGGRLADARFFWNNDRTSPLAARADGLEKVLFHARCGSYADKAKRMARLAADLAVRVAPEQAAAVREAAGIAKNDLTTGLVGEFPELQGVVGGLLLRHEKSPDPIWRGVYEHYKPASAEDSLPESIEGAIVSVADKLDSVGQLVHAGEIPTGSKDPFGLRRALAGVFRIVEARGWSLSLSDLCNLSIQSDWDMRGGKGVLVQAFIRERLTNYLRDRGYTLNEIQAVMKPEVSTTEFMTWPLEDIVARLEAIKIVRGRADFVSLVDLTKRVDNILVKGANEIERILDGGEALDGHVEKEPAAIALAALIDETLPGMTRSAGARRYPEIVDAIARFVTPVERFFAEVLVLDPKDPAATLHRKELLAGRLKPLLTQYFDIRELAGQAD